MDIEDEDFTLPQAEPARRVVFMGTPDFSLTVLAALVDAGHEVVCVYSQPPRKSGRGQKVTPSPVHAFAEQKGIECRTPKSLKSQEEQKAFQDLEADVAVVVAYGLILPKAILEAPTYGCLNAHASLLPRWRGAAPIQRAIEAGDDASGVTIMQMDEGLDTGDMLLKQPVAITAETTGQSLHDSLSMESAQLVLEALRLIDTDKLKKTPQPEDGVTYAHKLDKAESLIDWQAPADVIERRIRAFTPWPGTWFERGKDRIKILQAEVHDAAGPPGTRLAGEDLIIACGEKSLKINKLQRSGKAPTDSRSFLRGFPVPVGS